MIICTPKIKAGALLQKTPGPNLKVQTADFHPTRIKSSERGDPSPWFITVSTFSFLKS